MSNYISHIATVEIPVSNLDRSVHFYVEVLGVEVEFKGEKNAMLSFQSKGVPTIFLVETAAEGKSLSFANSNDGVEHSVIDFYTPSLKELHQWLQEKNVEVGPLNLNQEHGLGGFGFKDPDGNLLSACNVLHKGQ
ncbi:VOC family protein [Bacillus sp. ISL-47]|uniref:VOC family protein n=1 Tax=Bacillus sp. ISL-47 TaxID=2819130 RepID=UPI001BEB921F|nr:VOC family protein [Bacillus sp. ISL-47]MBT2691155.1 VOC family protein [Bacillus sp. ISL-47]MBT2711057.1 VOC family protein [Pseudomonas sp. ISL-84]